MSRKNYKHLKVVGKTENGKPVISGYFKIISSEGIPVEIMLEQLHDLGFVPDIKHLLEEAKKANWDKDNVLTRLEGFAQDFYKGEERKEFIEKLNLMIEQVWKE